MKREINTRLRRARHIRRKIIGLQADRLCVHRTPRHIYAQIIDKTGGKVLVSASTVEADVRGQVKHGGNVEAAKLIGKRIAEKAKGAGITRVAFDDFEVLVLGQTAIIFIGKSTYTVARFKRLQHHFATGPPLSPKNYD